MYIRIYQNINIIKKTCYIKIVPTNCFACEAQQLKKAFIVYVERNKISKN